MSKYTVGEICKVIQKYRADAETKRQNAGYSGMNHDDGASKMLEKADAFLSGWNKSVPCWLEAVILELRQDEEKERAEYERLKKKYGE